METTKTDTPAPAAPTAPAPEIVRDERIVMALPCYGGKIDQPFMQCVLHMCGTINVVPFIDFMPGDSLVNRARNNLAHNFLNGYPGERDGKPTRVLYDWLLFVDTDLIFQPDAVTAVFEMAKRRGVGIYAGTYPIKQLKPKVVFNNMPGCTPDDKGEVEVREAGTGFMMIHRGVFEKMVSVFSDEMRFESDMGDMQGPRTIKYDFFTVGVRRDPILGYKRFLSEDWYFCQRWREMGGKIWMKTTVQCGHIGSFVFPGNPLEIIEVADHLRNIQKKVEEAATAKPLVVKVGPPEHFAPPEPVAMPA